MHEDDQYFFEMLSAGAPAMCPNAAPNELIGAIHAVSGGGMFLFPSVARVLVNEYLQRRESPGAGARGFEELTEREREVRR